MRRLGAAALVVSIGLACRGGGSGSGDGQLTQIQTANAENVAREVLLALDLTFDLSVIGGEVAGGDAQSAASAGTTGTMRVAPAVALAASAPVGPITVDCEHGGSVTLTGTVSSPDTLTPNDRFTGDFDHCVGVDAVVPEASELDGPLDFTVLSFAGDLADLFSLTLDLAFCDPDTSSTCDRAFSFTQPGSLAFTLEGRARTSIDATAPPVLKSSAAGSTLALQQGQDSLTLRGFQTTAAHDLADQTYQLVGTGRLASTGFDGDPATEDGEVRYDVTPALAGAIGSSPSEGVVEVTGAKSNLRIVPLAGFNIDFGTTFPAPDPTYGAASGQVGRWNSVGLGQATLVGLIGGTSGVTVDVSASTATRASTDAPIDEDQRLLNDEFASSDGGSWSVTISGLPAGDHVVFLYAPSDAVVSGEMEIGGNPIGSLAGDPDGALIEGTSWLAVPVSGSGPLVITGSSSSGTSPGLAGLQIVPAFADDVDLEVDADGDGDFEDTIPTTWTCLFYPDTPGCPVSP